ncbi:hypothetical protein GJAV_G00024800 [Gymnothorax javanicus]|nr:hypothetical protein GJAV_G00024800 [Gymnothorax javanicus]
MREFSQNTHEPGTIFRTSGAPRSGILHCTNEVWEETNHSKHQQKSADLCWSERCPNRRQDSKLKQLSIACGPNRSVKRREESVANGSRAVN